MRISDVDLLIVPGWMNSSPDHWQSRWEAKLSTARRVAMPDFDRPVLNDWVGALISAVRIATRPVVFVAHSCGATAIAHAAPHLPADKVIGAMLVTPPDRLSGPAINAFILEHGNGVRAPQGFDPAPLQSLPFPSLLVASRNDPFCSFDRAEELAAAWKSTFIDAGEAGHINAASGYGPWPDGALRLANFMQGLTAVPSDRKVEEKR